MREIKFRAWHKRDRLMHPVIVWSQGDFVAVPEVGLDGWELAKKKLTAVELMQYTGLKDKNGVEIYEGDILFQKTTEHFKQFNDSVWERKYQVKFGENDWRESHAGNNTVCFYLESISSYTNRIGINQYDLLNANYPFEVIGNIYENPELVK